MRTTALFFLYLVICLALAAVLTVPLMQTGWLDYPPERVMSRLAQVMILLGLWPFLRSMGLANWASLGYGVPRREFVRSLVRGWVLGVLILVVLALALYLLGIRIPGTRDLGWLYVAEKAAQALIGGILIGFLEESFFRGALFTAIRRRGGVAAAVLGSAFLFCIVHFMKPGGLDEGTPFDWGGALQMFTGVFGDAFEWANLDSMAALFMVGVFLALVRERAGHIGWCIGLHAGWVFVIQVTRRITEGNVDSPWAFLAGNFDGVIGWLSAAWIGMLAIGYWGWYRGMSVSPRHREPKA